MGEIADDHAHGAYEFGGYYDEPGHLGDFYGDYFGGRAHQYRPPPDRTAKLDAFPVITEDEMKEAPIEKYLRDEVKKLGGEHRKIVYQGRTGSPDDWCFLPGGRLIIVECKAPGKKPTAQQLDEIKWLCGMGFKATWVDTKAKIDALLAPYQEDEWL